MRARRRDLLCKRWIGMAAEQARDEGKRIGGDIVVRAAGILGRHAFAAVALVEVAAAGDELEVLNERAVVRFAGALVARWPRAALQAITWL